MIQMITSVDHNMVCKKGISSKDALICRTEAFRKFVNDNIYVSAAFLDLSRTFDSLWQKVHLANLHHKLNFSDQSNFILCDYLNDGFQKIFFQKQPERI